MIHGYTVIVYRYTKRDATDSGQATGSGQATLTRPRLGGEAFRRDAPTLLCYGAIAVYAFWLYAYGPELALLQTELHFSYTVLGVYSALWSAGAALTGICFARLARRLPRAPLLWSSAAGTVDFPQVLADLQDRIHLARAFREKVVSARLGLDFPY